MKNVLIVVDMQNDFACADGALYVDGGEKIAQRVKELIASGQYSEVIFTVDWHTLCDTSFEKYGGTWPRHCVQYTKGAALVDGLVDVCEENHIVYSIFEKGTNPLHEEYGAFEICSKISDGLFFAYNSAHMSPIMLTADAKYDICGLAGDYCVLETYKNLKKIGIVANPVYDAIGFIGKKFDYE